MLNLSTEDLVTNEVAATPGLPSMFNWMETLYLILLNFAHTIFQTMLPTAEIMFYVIVRVCALCVYQCVFKHCISP